MLLHIANKNYSSWSLRPWLVMTVFDIPFEERLTRFNDDAGNPEFRKFSPSGKVPVLVDGDLTVWDSLAIIEYLAETFPERAIWPADRAMRAHARAISAEMHSGFGALRSACPMNLRRPTSAIAVSDQARADVARVEDIWSDCLQRHGGPFLFGQFCAADAMYAPVVNRLGAYALSSHEAVLAYSAAIRALPAWQAWEAAGIAEPWIIPADEV